MMNISTSDTSLPDLVPSITTCIVGGGNSAHVLIPFLSQAGHRIHLLTRRPNDWNDVVYCHTISDDAIVKTHSGLVHQKSSHPSEVVPQADVIVLCMPVSEYRSALCRLAPYVNPRSKDVFIGTIYGQGGFNWMVHTEVESKFNLKNVVTFAVGSIPWICRTLEYGKSVANYGGKKVNLVAVTPARKFDKLNRVILRDMSERPLGGGKFTRTCSFLSLTMSVDNQIIHPARVLGLWEQNNRHGRWPSAEAVPFFYRDFDQPSADNLLKLDAEYSDVRAAIRKHFPDRDFKHMLSYLELENLNHSSGNVDILASLKDSKQLANIKTPTVVATDGVSSRVLDTNFRFFTDDIGYGLVICKWIAQKLGVETPFIDKVILWSQDLRGEHFLDPGTHKLDIAWCLQNKFVSGIPETYGIRSIEDILD